MTSPTFSIVMPVYNVENYLSQSVNSILSQTCKDYELILVDDGSTDSSPLICDEFAKNNKHIVVIHKSNEGASKARNCGIEVATGKYIIFIDSDDYWDNQNALEELNKIVALQAPDVITWRYKKFFESNSTTSKSVGYNCPSLERYTPEELLKSNNFSVSAWCKAIKNEILKKHNLFFKAGALSEDVLWSAQLICATTNIIPSNLDFYVYRQREGSISHSISKKSIDDIKDHITAIKSLCGNNDGTSNELLSLYLAQEFTNFVVTLSLYDNFTEEKIWVKQNKNILNYAFSRRSKILNLMFGILGITLTIKTIRCLRKI